MVMTLFFPGRPGQVLQTSRHVQNPTMNNTASHVSTSAARLPRFWT
jgi:hypothetical protein